MSKLLVCKDHLMLPCELLQLLLKQLRIEVYQQSILELELQEDMDTWIHHYNYDRPHRAYRKMGKRPIETIE